MKRRHLLGLSAVAAAGWMAKPWPRAASAAALASPLDPVILVVDGAIGVGNGAGEAAFDRAMLERLPAHEVTTLNPWEKEPATYGGVLISDLLDLLAATGQSIKAHALNDYEAEIPVEEARRYGVLLAFRRNGKVMDIAEKGPLFVVYPFSKFPELLTETHLARSVWQVDRLTIGAQVTDDP